jgi:hypothetical protein
MHAGGVHEQSPKTPLRRGVIVARVSRPAGSDRADSGRARRRPAELSDDPQPRGAPVRAGTVPDRRRRGDTSAMNEEGGEHVSN